MINRNLSTSCRVIGMIESLQLFVMLTRPVTWVQYGVKSSFSIYFFFYLLIVLNMNEQFLAFITYNLGQKWILFYIQNAIKNTNWALFTKLRIVRSVSRSSLDDWHTNLSLLLGMTYSKHCKHKEPKREFWPKSI